MGTFIKSEPIDYDEFDFNQNVTSNEKPSYIESQFQSEQVYINNIQNVLNSKCDDVYDYLNDFMPVNNASPLIPERNICLLDAFLQISNSNSSSSNTSSKVNEDEARRSNNKPSSNKLKTSALDNKAKINKMQEHLAKEKKRILLSLVESAKEKKMDSLLPAHSQYEPLSVADEHSVYLRLKRKLESMPEEASLYAYRRLKCKLDLRRLKRKNHMKLFDIDSYVNELIDREKISKSRRVKSEQLEANCSESNTNEVDDGDVIMFEKETLKSVDDSSSGCEIIAVKDVLDRFKFASHSFQYGLNYKSTSFQMPIGMVQARNDDIKCVLSPMTNKLLKPYVRRDYESVPKKLLLNFQISTRKTSSPLEKFDRYPIDYVHLRPEHVFQINSMCEQHFWKGIDIAECLQYPDYTIVAMYRKLIIGFAFLVPNVTHNESYLSFIFVHPDWRKSAKGCNNSSVSVAQYLLYYLVRINRDYDITLHVSVNSPAVIFYLKFGFQIEEFIKNFYDKYYSDGQNLNKDAFLMRLMQR